jgi:tRNA threonylcarbamoyladenosine biosynthesis protein TsaE
MTTLRIFLSKSPDDTINFAAAFAKTLSAGSVIALIGSLGSGKTTFTKGIAKGLGVKGYKYVNSPSFVLIKEYSARVPLYHFDLYRLDKIKDIEDLDSDGYFFGKGITVIEWADKCKVLLPKPCIKVEFKIEGENERRIVIARSPKGVTKQSPR